MVQETHMEELPKLPGYHVHASPPNARTCNIGAAHRVCTFVRKGLTLIKLDRLFNDTAFELCAVEVVIGRKKQESVFMLTDWNAFRQQEIAPTIEDLEEWMRSLVDATERESTEIETDDTTSFTDPKLAYLIGQAEEAAIVLALNGTPEVTTILSDSRTAIANLGRGSIGTPATSLLPRSKSTTKHL
ncbi:hypothetical protein MRX96_037150 [Rhipicephalus microplus]